MRWWEQGILFSSSCKGLLFFLLDSMFTTKAPWYSQEDMTREQENMTLDIWEPGNTFEIALKPV